jgi:hypothetical protein
MQLPCHLASLPPPPPPQNEDIPARKKQRLGSPISTVAAEAEAITKIASPDVRWIFLLILLISTVMQILIP